MDKRRKSPPTFRSRGASIGFFVVALAILVVGCYLGLGMLTRYDYEGVLPEDANLRAKFSDDGYVVPEATPTPEPVVTPTPLPTPAPTPAATPLPLELYCAQNTQLVMPSNATAPGEALLSSMQVSAGDHNQSILVKGWAFLDGCDAMNSNIYLVVSAKAGSVHRFYQVDIKPGSSGVTHDASRGANLDRADFQAAFKVKTYEEGPYRLGILVVNKAPKAKSETKGYFDVSLDYQFQVKSNAVINVG